MTSEPRAQARMALTARQTEILNAARSAGRITVDGLALSFAVTPQTIRRDLNELCRQNLLTRVHGGAVPATSVANVAYEERRELASDAKRRIGLTAAALVPDNCSVTLNIGTTTEQVARALHGHRDLVVITNNLNVVNILGGGGGAREVIVTGGVVRPSDGGIVGEAAVEFIRQFKVDYAVIGASALDEDGAVLDFDYREVSVARAIVANARRTILVADHGKFERSAPVRVCELAELDALVTDREPPRAFRDACTEAGVAVHVASEDDDEAREPEGAPESADHAASAPGGADDAA